MSRGVVVCAVNTDSVDYVECADMLAMSLKKVMDCSVTLISNKKHRSKYFDTVKLCSDTTDTEDPFKVAVDEQIYKLSPYTYTIKLEADMYIPQSIDYWWDILEKRDVVISTTIRDYKGDISDSRAYRKFIDENNLPDVYNAITYFKKSPLADRFFKVLQNVRVNWDQYKEILVCSPKEKLSTDWAYAITCHIIGKELTTLPHFKQMSMVHMKQAITKLPSEQWTDVLVPELVTGAFRVNTFDQRYPFHYHVKGFSAIIKNTYVR